MPAVEIAYGLFSALYSSLKGGFYVSHCNEFYDQLQASLCLPLFIFYRGFALNLSEEEVYLADASILL